MVRRRLYLGLALVALLFGAGHACKRRRLYDGTCTEDAHCLDIQKCQGGVCVRRKPIFEESSPPVAQQPASKRAKAAPIEPRVIIDRRTSEPPSPPEPARVEPPRPLPSSPAAPGRTRMLLRLDA